MAAAAFVATSYAPAGYTPEKELIAISFDKHEIKAEVVRTDADKQKGLGGRQNIGSPGAMLFVYDAPHTACFWMKDMHFSIDIIWLNADKKVISIKDGVNPNTYPESFCPKEHAQYVLELPDGKSRELGLRTGMQLQF